MTVVVEEVQTPVDNDGSDELVHYLCDYLLPGKVALCGVDLEYDREELGPVPDDRWCVVCIELVPLHALCQPKQCMVRES